MRDHGGDLDRAKKEFGGEGWIDLSTGINPVSWPVPTVPERAWRVLPTRDDIHGLVANARRAYDTGLHVVPVAGAQAAIQIVPRLAPAGRARVLVPTYNEHAGALSAQGWHVEEVRDLDELAGTDIAVVVNPNNPTGTFYDAEALLAVAERVGLLVVDESFVDPMPHLSLATRVGLPENILILRSFGKFYGLAGMRLGFVLAGAEVARKVDALAGPWAVSGPSIFIGSAALADEQWRTETRLRLETEAARLDGLAALAGWALVGGTPLFRTYATESAKVAQETLAKAQVWTRIFPYSQTWIRLGLPGGQDAWERLEAALARGGQ